MFGSTYTANVCEYKILRFGGNPQKYQTLVPAKIVTLRYVYCIIRCQGGVNKPGSFKASQVLDFVLKGYSCFTKK